MLGLLYEWVRMCLLMNDDFDEAIGEEYNILDFFYRNVNKYANVEQKFWQRCMGKAFIVD